jgi:hypothetical protein
MSKLTASGNVTAGGTNVGGLFGSAEASIIDATATGQVTNTAGDRVGGLVGFLSAKRNAEVTNVSATERSRFNLVSFPRKGTSIQRLLIIHYLLMNIKDQLWDRATD